MKKYATTTILSFITILLIVFLGTYFFYQYTSKKVIENKVSQSLLITTNAVEESLSYKIDFDYNRLKDIIDSSNKITTSIFEDVFPEDFNFSYGKITQEGFEYQNKLLLFSSKHKNDYYFSNQISIVYFSDIFLSSTDETRRIAFRIDDYILFVDADKYLSKSFILSDDLPQSSYFIISKDGIIVYQEDYSKSGTFYDYYLRRNNSDEWATKKTKEIQDNKKGALTGVYVDGENKYICYSHLSSKISNNLITIYVFDEDSAFASMGMVSYQLIGLFICYVILFAIGFVVIVILLNKKNSDIEASKLIHYYDKPYIIRVNKTGKVLSYNKTMKSLIPRGVKYKNINDFSHDNNIDLLDAINRQTSFIINFKDCNEKIKSIIMIPVKNTFSKYLVGTDIDSKNNEYKNKSLHSQITNLPNLDYLYEVLEKHLKYLDVCMSKELEIPNSALVLIDIKQFSNFNKVFGRRMGNLILQKISEIMNDSLKNYCASLYHTEIDLFAVFFSSVDKYEDVITWIEGLISSFKRPFDIEGNSLVVELKSGIFNIEIEKYKGITAREIYDDTQITLLQAKTLTSLKYAVYNVNFSNFISKEQAIMEDLRIAIKNEEFVMYFQAQYDNLKERIVGFEALVRWDNPKYKFHSPSHFIEIAEKNNMIIQIGRFIMEQTFAAAKKFEPYDIHVSMNVSPVQLLQAGFVTEILECSKKYDLKPGTVAIEITETFLMENFNFIIEKLNLLKNKGFSIHLDDFGTGYSSMLYLKQLPINTIKIDKEFTRHLVTDKYSRAIVSKIVQLAKNLELDVIAEGVETDEQNQILVKNGCNVIQGYLISKGISFDDAMVLVDQYNISKSKHIQQKKPRRGDK